MRSSQVATFAGAQKGAAAGAVARSWPCLTWSEGGSGPQRGDHVGKDVADLVAHRQKNHDDDDRDQDENQGVLDHPLAGLTSGSAAQLALTSFFRCESVWNRIGTTWRFIVH